MAFGSSSKVFMAFIEDALERTAAFDMNADTFKVALFGNSGTPDQTVAAANTAYNAGQWVSGNEVTATGWTAGGLSLASVTSAFSSNVYTFDAADKSGGASDTVTNAYGVLIYDDTLTTPVADQGVCYLAFGGANSVTSGTFTVAFNASGIMTFTA
jgi:hypothetical protein